MVILCQKMVIFCPKLRKIIIFCQKIIQKLVFLGQFNAFLNKNVQKMVILCQKIVIFCQKLQKIVFLGQFNTLFQFNVSFLGEVVFILG